MRRLLILALLLSDLLPGVSFGAVAFGTIGAATGSANVAYPASIAAGDMLVMCSVTKYPTYSVDTPSGWTLATNATGTGGAGASGAGTGTIIVKVFYKEATGSESGTLAITASGSPFNVLWSIMARYTRTNTAWAAPTAANGADSVQDSGWSVTGGTDPGVTTNDMIVTCSGANAAGTFTASAITQTGVTFGAATEEYDNGTGSADDVGLKVVDLPVTAGPSSDVPTYTATCGGTNMAGSTVFLRLREMAAVPSLGNSLGFLEVDE